MVSFLKTTFLSEIGWDLDGFYAGRCQANGIGQHASQSSDVTPLFKIGDVSI